MVFNLRQLKINTHYHFNHVFCRICRILEAIDYFRVYIAVQIEQATSSLSHGLVVNFLSLTFMEDYFKKLQFAS